MKEWGKEWAGRVRKIRDWGIEKEKDERLYENLEKK